MANIKINDIESSNSDLLCELSEEEMVFIQGQGLLRKLVAAALIIGGAFTTPVGIGSAMIGAGGAILASDDTGFSIKEW